MCARTGSIIWLLVAGLGCARQAGSPVGTETGDASTEVGSSEGESTSESTDDNDSESSSESTGDEVDECVPSLYEDCWAMAEDALAACVQACACGDLECGTTCYQGHETAYWACVPDEVQRMCGENFEWDVVEHCYDACELATSSCSCDANACTYVGYGCAWTCGGCPPEADFIYAYADSCEITLPGPLDHVNAVYTFVQVGDQEFYFGGEITTMTCDDPSNPGYIWLSDVYDTLLLCPTACEAFANVGELTVEVGTPPCE
jgi:hypothetical protein